MTDAERKQINQRLAALERASALFDRFGGYIPLAIAYLNGWPREVELYPHWQVGGLDLKLSPRAKFGISYFGTFGAQVRDQAAKGSFTWNF